MKSTIDRVSKGYNLAVLFIILSGAAFFIYYSLLNSKLMYLLIPFVIYSLGYLVRKKILRVEDSEGFREPGILLVSFLVTAYILYLTNIDREIENFLPDKLLMKSGSLFFLIILISFIPSLQNIRNKLAITILAIATILYIIFQQTIVDALFQVWPQVVDYIIGIPLLYLISIVFGVRSYFKKSIK